MRRVRHPAWEPLESIVRPVYGQGAGAGVHPLCWPPGHPGTKEDVMTRHDEAPAPGTPCWFDLVSPDAEAAAAFYAALFGWTYDVAGPEHGHYRMAMVDGRPAAGIGQRQEGTETPSAWTVYLAADDAATMAERATGLGGSVVAEPMEVPGMGRMAIV